jgi:hypothetical protein
MIAAAAGQQQLLVVLPDRLLQLGGGQNQRLSSCSDGRIEWTYLSPDNSTSPPGLNQPVI